VLGPTAVVAGVTVLVCLLDPLTGSNLVIDAPMGSHRVLAARFYGESNQSFSLLLAAGVLLAVVVGDVLLRRGRRRAAVLAIALLGLACVLVDGSPSWGADFGGPPGLILAFTMLAVSASGRRVSWKVLGSVVGIAVLVVGGFALLDYLRPPADRTHLGRFVASSLQGGLADTIGRKLATNILLLTSWRYLVLAIAGIALTWVVVANPKPGRGALLGSGSPLAGLRRAVPLLRPGVAALGMGLLAAFLINDSGIVVPATGIAVAVPCLVAAAALWRLDNPGENPDDESPTPDAAPLEAAAP
jgi:MFS family permease